MEIIETRESVTLQSGGYKLFGILHLPKNVKNPPVVFFCHGLAGNKIGKDRIYVEIAQRLAEIGIASFRLDCRGSGDSEGLFQDFLPEHFIEDVLAGLEYLKKNPLIDKNRIGIFARSFGGPIAIQAASRFKDIKSLVLWCPMFSGKQWMDQWQQMANQSIDPESAQELMRINGQQGSIPFFEQFMKINIEEALAKLDSIPLLHIHGESDERVTLEHALDYERVRSSSKEKSHFLRLPNSDHDFSNYQEKQQAIEKTLEWFDATLNHQEKIAAIKKS